MPKRQLIRNQLFKPFSSIGSLLVTSYNYSWTFIITVSVIFLQCFVLLAFVGAAAAFPRPDDAPVRGYGAPPPVVPAYGKPVEELPPQPYQYEYGVSDGYSGSNYQAVESQDNQGTVIGKTAYEPH